MANILSQSEIDELLSALADGDAPEAESEEIQDTDGIQKYDFRTADKFSKEQMRTLQLIYENYALRVGTALAGALHSICDAELISIEEQAFSEFSNSLPSNTLLAILSMPPLQGSAMLEIPTTLAYEIISSVFGGEGQLEETDKQFTDIDLAILSRALRFILEPMGDAWERVAEVSVSLDRIETSAQFAQIVQGNEPIAIITMSLSIGSTKDLINLVIPHMALQPISKQLGMRTWYSDSTSVLEDTKDLTVSPQLANTQVTMSGIFNETLATINDIVSLQIGDVIRLDHDIHDSLTVRIEHIPKFKGYIGTKDNRYAIQVSDILEEEIADESE